MLSAVVVAIVLMVSACAAETLAEYVLLPPYEAVSVYVLGVKALVVYVAFPVASSAPLPSTVDPFRKFTVPEGMALPEGPATTALRVTLWPGVEFAGDTARVVVLVIVGAIFATQPSLMLPPGNTVAWKAPGVVGRVEQP